MSSNCNTPASNTEKPAKSPKGFRLYLGLFFFALSWLMPLTGFIIADSKLPAAFKAILIGIFSVGGPEIVAIIAIAILGKESFEFITGKAFGFLKKIAPHGAVSKTRYRIGLVMFTLPLLPWYILAYAPQLLPASTSERTFICMAADLCFWSSLFVLGGDFWDKLRSLFIYEARAVIPQAIPTQEPAKLEN